MYKIVLIDDEMIVRDGMKELIPWGELGLELVGTAEDGIAGYELVVEKEPDIILLDINMPRCNGLELAKKVKADYPHIKIIFISGYDEFNYARQALRIGVEDYILKPITKAEMKTILLKIVGQLEEEEEEEKKTLDVLNRVEQSIPLMQQKVIQELVANQIHSNVITKQCMKANIPHNSVAYGVFLVDPDEQIEGTQENGQDELTRFVVQNIMNELLISKKWGVVFEIDGMTGALYMAKEECVNRRQELYTKHVESVQEAISEWMGIKVSIGVGMLVDNLEEVHHSYRQASQVLKNRFFKGLGQVIYYHKDTTYNKAHLGLWLKWEESMVNALTSRESFCNAIHNIGLEMKREKITLEDMQEIWGNMVCGMLKKMMEINGSIVSRIPSGMDIMHEFRKVKTLTHMQQWMIELYDMCQKWIADEVDTTQGYTEMIKGFIESHYDDSALSMKDLCNYVHISASYLGQILKREMGKTFVQYITEFRLEKAKELLVYTSLKTYEITEKVGYTDSHYFSVIFKKYTGMTPSEYRKRNRHV